MTFEQGALLALASVTTALCFLFNLLRLRSEACEAWRAEKEPIITAMAQKLGIAEATANIVNACKIAGCPYAGKLKTSFSAEAKENPKSKP